MAHIDYGRLAIKGVRGRMGDAVFVREANGSYGVRSYTTPRNPRTPAQIAVRQRFVQATTAFRNLDAAHLALWEEYAAAHGHTDPDTGQVFTPNPITLFVALSTKYLQVNPTGAIPLAPPTEAFAGDTITVSATAGAGQITFAASGANASGVETELLLQKLATPNRRPRPKEYRSADFVTFAGGTSGSTATVPTAPGYYAAAYRFVKTATGQDTLPVPIPVTGTVTLELLKAA